VLLLLGTVAPVGSAVARAAGLGSVVAGDTALGLAYPPLLAALGGPAVLLGVAQGALAVVVLGAVAPRTHPRLRGDGTTLETPGLLLTHYGALSAPVLVGAHALYGAAVGAFAG
jgi:hypothetical protein